MYSSDIGRLVLRLCLGGLMLFHGVHKVLHPGSLDFIGSRLNTFSLPPELAYGVYLGEVLAPLMIIFGFGTRLGGLMIVINMVFAILLVHSHELTMLTSHGGWQLELQAFYLFGGLAVALLGSGRIALSRD